MGHGPLNKILSAPQIAEVALRVAVAQAASRHARVDQGYRRSCSTMARAIIERASAGDIGVVLERNCGPATVA